MLMFLDGYVEDEHGRFDFAAPAEEVNPYINQLTSSVGTYLYGRRMCESMVYWETAHTVPNLPQFLRDWTRGWTLSATMADCKLTTFQVNACRYPSLTPFEVNTSAKHEGGIPPCT